MRYRPISRRHFLQGIGAGLALPLLPSLMPKEARAQAANRPKYFVALGTMHGGVPIEAWAPIDATLNETQLYSGAASQGRDHRMRSGALANLTRPSTHTYNPSGSPELSPVLGSFLNPYLDKLTLLTGLDVMFHMGHHARGHLGDYHSLIDSDISSNLLLPSMPTIDRVIARSPNFYPAGDPFTVRSINFNNGMHISGDGPVGSVSRQPETAGERARARMIFDAVFGDNWTSGGGSGGDPRLSAIDRVIDDYRRVMNSPFGEGSYISQSDRERLDEFVTGLNDVEQKLQNLGGSCDDVTAPGSDVWLGDDDHLHADIAGKWPPYLDVIVAAFKCGRSRVATIGTNELADDYSGNWHTDIAHGGHRGTPRDYIIRSNRFAAEGIYTYLIDQLDVSIDGVSDTTYLDDALVVWNHESGQQTHSSVSVPTLVAGSAGGFIQPGMFFDYRNLSNNGVLNTGSSNSTHPQRPGIPYNRWLYTALRAMGVRDEEFRVGPLASMPGYGDSYVYNEEHGGHRPYGNDVLNDMGSMLTDIVA